MSPPCGSPCTSVRGWKALRPALHPTRLSPVGDLDGDGVPEMLLKWAIPDVVVGAEVAPAPDSRPLWGVYLLSWTGARWKPSRLLTGVEDFTPLVINLGPPVGRGPGRGDPGR